MLAKDVPHARLTGCDEPRELGGALVGKTGNGVLLVQGNGNAELSRGAHERQLEICPKTDRNIRHGQGARLKLAHQAVLLTR